MKELVIYVHGKGGEAEEAEHYKPLFPKSDVIGFDYKSQIRFFQNPTLLYFRLVSWGLCVRIDVNDVNAFIHQL